MPPEPCDFPACAEAVAIHRPDGTRTCHTHEHVHVSGSYVPDRHTTTSQE